MSLAHRCLDLLEPQLRVLRFHLALDERPQPFFEQVQRFPDAFVIRDRHRLSPLTKVLDIDVTPVPLEVLGNEPAVAVMGLVLAAQKAAVREHLS